MPFSEVTVATAKLLAARRRRAIHVLSMLNGAAHLPIDAPLRGQEERAQAKIERAKLIGGQRVTGRSSASAPARRRRRSSRRRRRSRPRDRHAAHLPQRPAPVRQDPPGRARARPCRVMVTADPASARTDRRGAAAEPGAADRRGLPRRRPGSSRRHPPLRYVIVIVTLAAGGGPLSTGVLLGVLFWRSGRALLPGEPELTEPPVDRLARPALPRRSLALGGRPLGDRLLDLLRARARRRPRTRADAADLPRRRPALRADDHDLRRGRRDVHRARRIDDARPPCLQRAGQLRRRLGDPDRLRDRDRPGGDHGAALPHADLGGVRRRRGRDRGADRRDRRSSPWSTSSASPGAAGSGRSRRWRAPTSCCSCC